MSLVGEKFVSAADPLIAASGSKQPTMQGDGEDWRSGK